MARPLGSQQSVVLRAGGHSVCMISLGREQPDTRFASAAARPQPARTLHRFGGDSSDPGLSFRQMSALPEPNRRRQLDTREIGVVIGFLSVLAVHNSIPPYAAIAVAIIIPVAVAIWVVRRRQQR